MLWESLEIPDTILTALWVRIISWKVTIKSQLQHFLSILRKYTWSARGSQKCLVLFMQRDDYPSTHLLPECRLLTIAWYQSAGASCPRSRHCAVIGFTAAWHHEYLPDFLSPGIDIPCYSFQPPYWPIEACDWALYGRVICINFSYQGSSCKWCKCKVRSAAHTVSRIFGAQFDWYFLVFCSVHNERTGSR